MLRNFFATCAAIFFLISFIGCEKSEDNTATWADAEAELVTEPDSPKTESKAPQKDKKAVEKEALSDGSAIRFIAYNVENWLSMERYENRKSVGTRTKPEKEKEAIVTLLTRYQPDVLGICEIGQEEDVIDLKNRLKESGVDLPNHYLNEASDPVRRLALLTRYPISKVTPHENLTYKLQGKTFSMSRGILDVTVDSPLGPMRFVGVHLKSKREVPEADQEMMRRSEAHLLRKTVDQILTEDPSTKLIAYGDYNDTRQSSAIRTARGPRSGPLSLKMLWTKDSRGQSWTHHWARQDVYSRLDYVLFSPPMSKYMQWDECKIIDDEEWEDGSDHRPILVLMGTS